MKRVVSGALICAFAGCSIGLSASVPMINYADAMISNVQELVTQQKYAEALGAIDALTAITPTVDRGAYKKIAGSTVLATAKAAAQAGLATKANVVQVAATRGTDRTRALEAENAKLTAQLENAKTQHAKAMKKIAALSKALKKAQEN